MIDWVEAGKLLGQKDEFTAAKYRSYHYQLCIPRMPCGTASALHHSMGNLEMTPDILWLIGQWLTSGTAVGTGLSFYIRKGLQHFDKLLRILSELNLDFTVTDHPTATIDYKSVSCDGDLAIAIYKLFEREYGYLDKKSLSWQFLTSLSSEQAQHILNGIFNDDKLRAVRVTSRDLAWHIRLLLTKIGQYSAIDFKSNKYTVSRIENSLKPGDEYLFLPIYEVRQTPFVGMVYNLEVETDNSYNVGTPVHNCEIYFNDYEPLRQSGIIKRDVGGVVTEEPIQLRKKEWRFKPENVEIATRMVRNRHLTVLCKNETGFHNLLKLTTQAYETGLFGLGKTQYNRIWFDKLCEFKEGLIILSGCLNGPVCHELRMDKITQKLPKVGSADAEEVVLWSRSERECVAAAARWVKKFKQVFGDDYYMELQMPGVPGDDKVFRHSVALADHYGIKTVLTNDSHYITRADYDLQKIMMAIAQNTHVNDENLFYSNSNEQYFKERNELWARFKNCAYSEGIGDSLFEESCDNSLLIADKCQHIKMDTSLKIPDIFDADQELKRLVATRLVELGFDKCETKFLIDGRQVTYVEQAKIELKRFIDKGFSSYFLITKNIINYGKSKGWPFSPRGCSTPGTLITTGQSEHKRIEDIQIGDDVIDGFGKTQKVENKFIYDVSEELYVFELDGRTLELTADHKLYVIRGDEVMLLSASEIKDTDDIIGSLSDGKDTHVEDNNSNL